MTVKLRRVLFSSALLLLLAIVQVTLAPLIGISGIVPSFLLIGTVFVSLREGQMIGMLVAFPAGLMADSYLSALVGITALGLTIAAFAAGFYHDEEKTPILIRSPRVMFIVFLSAILFHTVYVFAYFQSLQVDVLYLLASHVIGASLYTTVLSAIPVLLLSRRMGRLKV
ncbi:MAG: rod shape-determining protein MreD [Bacteroidota bacterium]|jgi:rod shape-determining protein MreD